MNRPEKDRILEHEYDGIREYDNPLPGWWLVVLYATVAWSIGYVAWMHLGPGVAARQARFAALDRRLAEKAASALTDFGSMEPELLVSARDPTAVAAGKAIFAMRCISWKTMLSKDEMKQAVAYVASLRGTKPAAPKPPQGDLATGNDLSP